MHYLSSAGSMCSHANEANAPQMVRHGSLSWVACRQVVFSAGVQCLEWVEGRPSTLMATIQELSH